MNQDLSIGMIRFELPPGLFKIATQGKMVVDFAIKSDPGLAVAVGHRLTGLGGQIDDGETTVGEANALIVRSPDAIPIGTAMNHGIAHTPQK